LEQPTVCSPDGVATYRPANAESAIEEFDLRKSLQNMKLNKSDEPCRIQLGQNFYIYSKGLSCGSTKTARPVSIAIDRNRDREMRKAQPVGPAQASA
jgi:hypothetical protein